MHAGVNDSPEFNNVEYPYEICKKFPDTPEGIKQAFEYLKEQVSWLKNRGFCQHCLRGERPAKRIKLVGLDFCTPCLMGRMLE